MQKNSLSKATLGRLPCYLQCLREMIECDCEYVSATTISKKLSLGEVQVRKDLGSISKEGRPKIGYSVKDLIVSIENALGYNNLAKAVIVGAGKLGQALLNFEGFEEYGVEIAGAFDILPEKTDGLHREIHPMTQFETFCKENNVKIGIITSSEKSAQSICDLMTQNGIRAIWNFTPTKLCVSEDVIVKQENLALSVAYLNNLVRKNQEDIL